MRVFQIWVAFALAGCVSMPPETGPEIGPAVVSPASQSPMSAPDPVPTIVHDATEKARLFENTGLTLQWIDWD